MILRTIIVDDEPLAIEILEAYLKGIEEIDYLGSFQNVASAKEFIEENVVDLILLDIQMPGTTGIEYVKSMEDPPFIIFCTAYPQFALDGFELEALDYLVKPISKDRFEKAISKALEQFKLIHVYEMNESAKSQDHFFVKSDKRQVKINFSEVLYIEGLKDYVIIKLETGRVITLMTMKSLEEKLPEDIFSRIHRSYIVNIQKVTALNSREVILIEKNQQKSLPIGKNYRDEFLKKMNQEF